jgi:hypothetical protein
LFVRSDPLRLGQRLGEFADPDVGPQVRLGHLGHHLPPMGLVLVDA